MEIIEQYITNNPCFKNNQTKAKTGYMQHSTATPGAMAERFITNWNKASAEVAVEFIIDNTGIYQLMPIGIRSWHGGGSSNNTHVGCEVCEPQDTRLISVNWLPLNYGGSNNTTWVVTRLQQELIEWGYDPKGVDGSFGPGCKAAVEQFQKDNGLSVDGSVGPATLARFQTREGSLLKYDPEANSEYFKDVYRKAVYTAAHVIKELGSTVNDTNVLSHAEGYKKGIATNHADVGHWWPLHGKSMDDFRTDVKTYMANGVLPFDEPVQNNDGDVLFVIYTVKEGDTWWSISKEYLGAGNRYPEILDYNGLQEGATLKPGDTIKILVDSTESVTPPEQEEPTTSMPPPPDEASDWAKIAWDKAYVKGCMDGTNPKGTVTREMLAVVLNSLELLD